jgi:hypothetical protein
VVAQTPVLQSAFAVQSAPEPHFEHATPPQSVAVSLPFWTPSSHVAARHVPPTHTALVQSAEVLQCWLGPHDEQGPPQSTSVSPPFWSESVHDGATQACDTQLELAQSEAIEHAFAVSHFGQTAPPQSTSVS